MQRSRALSVGGMFVLGRDMYYVSTGASNSGSSDNNVMVVVVVISTGSDAFRWIQGRRLE
jgi:hypothetical protein